MKKDIRQLLREYTETKKSVSIKYLQGLLKNTTNKSAQKVLKQWIGSGGDKVMLTLKQYDLLKVIEKGGPKPNMYSPKN